VLFEPLHRVSTAAALRTRSSTRR